MSHSTLHLFAHHSFSINFVKLYWTYLFETTVLFLLCFHAFNSCFSATEKEFRPALSLPPPHVQCDPALPYHKNITETLHSQSYSKKRFCTQRSVFSCCSILSWGNLTSVRAGPYNDRAEISGYELQSTGTPTEILFSRSRQ